MDIVTDNAGCIVDIPEPERCHFECVYRDYCFLKLGSRQVRYEYQ